jgi:folate-binding Fe-S cluster repair protein YgfZ
MSNDYKAVQLHNRSKIEISGDDKIEFLQGLLTQDITLLNALPLLYACLLTPQGKFLHDMFLFQNDNSIIIDCEGLERANDLYKRFKKYKLRSKVTITEPSTLTVYQIWNGDFNESLQDPRHAACGYRLYSDSTGIKTVD